MYPFNGWKKIFQNIYKIYYEDYVIKQKIEKTKHVLGYGADKFVLEVDLIGKILFKVDGYNCIRFFEEILETDLLKHITIPEENRERFFQLYPIRELPEIDPFFAYRKFNNNESTIMDFFSILIKKYKRYIDKYNNENLEYPYPLIFILEDSQNIDEVNS
jgi:hypothetical protein